MSEPAVRLRLCLEDILRDRIPLFDGLEAVQRFARQVPELEGDRDVARLAGIVAEAEHLPIGPSRAHWSAEALRRFDPELMELERRHREASHYCCRRLLEALSR